MFLTDAEVRTLTGYHKPSKQAEQLRAQGIRFVLNRLGRPVVAREWLESGAATATKKTSPNFAALR